jgi:glycerol-3-phosphate dehydrogenase
VKALTRNLNALSSKEYDLLIVGGGIFGVCAAWDAALRGLSTAIVEKGDFSHATSANHFKMVHGGMRYLQHGDISRVRESSRERSALLRIAPHLVQPLPIVIPTYGNGLKGKPLLGAGMLLYDILTMDRNCGVQRERRIPWGKFISRKEVLTLFPGIKEEGLTGGAVFYDGQIYNPPRLAISFLRAAVDRGADAANYLEVTDFLKNNDRVLGVKAQDVLSKQQLEIRGKCVLNAAGPWAHRLLKTKLRLQLTPAPTFSRDLAFVVNRPVNHGHAIAVSTESGDADTIMDRGGRHLFAVSWRNHLLIGVWHVIFRGGPEEVTVSSREMQDFVNEVNLACPGLNIQIDEISIINMGLTLFGEEGRQKSGRMSFGKRSILIDHEREHDLKGLVTLIGVRATTARGMAEKAVDIVLKKLRIKPIKCKTGLTPIYGSPIGSFSALLNDALRNKPTGLNTGQITALVKNYGSQYSHILRYGDVDPTGFHSIGNSTVIKAEIIHAVREEMAEKLADVVFRRTDLGTGQIPEEKVLQECAKVVATELGWDRKRQHREIIDVQRPFHTIN